MIGSSTFKVIIAGSREFEDYNLLKEKCDYYLKNKLEDPECNVVIVSGNARGADSLGEKYAGENGLVCERYPADWKKYGKGAGMIRNSMMISNSDAAIVFLSAYGENKGSQNLIDTAKRNKLPIRVIREEE